MTIRAWRIVASGFEHSAFDGMGARLAGGRWNSRGVAAIYTASSLPLAALEMLAHLPRGSILRKYRAISADFDADMVADLKAPLPPDWGKFPAGDGTKTLGDGWLAGKTSAVLRVPSVVIQSESNFVLNPAHPDFLKIVVGDPQTFYFDPRLRK